MTFNDVEARRLLSGIFDFDYNEIRYVPVPFTDSRINTGSIHLYALGSKKIISKFTSIHTIKRFGKILTAQIGDEYMDMWFKAYPMFFLKDSYIREVCIYEGLDKKLECYLPKYYGSYWDDEHCYTFSEYIENTNEEKENNIESEITFISTLHNLYFDKEDVSRKIGAYVQSAIDFENSKELIRVWLERIKLDYPLFPDDIMNEFMLSLYNFKILYEETLKYGRTLCHGDFSHKNMKMSPTQIKVFDWEFASFCNPEFDIVNYLVRMHERINDIFIENILQRYKQKVNFRNSFNELVECLKMNAVFYFFVRFIGSMLRNSRSKPDRFLIEVDNFITLYRFLTKKGKKRDDTVKTALKLRYQFIMS